MNVYAINPELIIEDRLPYLLNILKVKRVISFIEYVPSICEPLLIYKANYDYNNYEDSVSHNIQQAVYKFNSPIYSPKYESGKWNGEFLTQDIYKESKAHNPIYNLEYCNDENVLVLINDYDTENYYKQFARYSLNILKKYASEYHYENRICFILFDDSIYDAEYEHTLFFNRTSMLSDCKFKSLVRYQPLKYDSRINLKVGQSYSIHNIPPLEYSAKQELKEKGLYYDPIISYIDIKSKLLYTLERKDSDILDFFLGDSHLNYLFNIKQAEIEEQEYYNTSSYTSEVQAWGAESEIEYINNNGGDWSNY